MITNLEQLTANPWRATSNTMASRSTRIHQLVSEPSPDLSPSPPVSDIAEGEAEDEAADPCASARPKDMNPCHNSTTAMGPFRSHSVQLIKLEDRMNNIESQVRFIPQLMEQMAVISQQLTQIHLNGGRSQPPTPWEEVRGCNSNSSYRFQFDVHNEESDTPTHVRQSSFVAPHFFSPDPQIHHNPHTPNPYQPSPQYEPITQSRSYSSDRREENSTPTHFGQPSFPPRSSDAKPKFRSAIDFTEISSDPSDLEKTRLYRALDEDEMRYQPRSDDEDQQQSFRSGGLFLKKTTPNQQHPQQSSGSIFRSKSALDLMAEKAYFDVMKKLHQLKDEGSFNDYLEEFAKLTFPVKRFTTAYNEGFMYDLLMDLFISGLQEDNQRYVLQLNPSKLFDAMELAEYYKEVVKYERSVEGGKATARVEVEDKIPLEPKIEISVDNHGDVIEMQTSEEDEIAMTRSEKNKLPFVLDASRSTIVSTDFQKKMTVKEVKGPKAENMVTYHSTEIQVAFLEFKSFQIQIFHYEIHDHVNIFNGSLLKKNAGNTLSMNQRPPPKPPPEPPPTPPWPQLPPSSFVFLQFHQINSTILSNFFLSLFRNFQIRQPSKMSSAKKLGQPKDASKPSECQMNFGNICARMNFSRRLVIKKTSAPPIGGHPSIVPSTQLFHGVGGKGRGQPSMAAALMAAYVPFLFSHHPYKTSKSQIIHLSTFIKQMRRTVNSGNGLTRSLYQQRNGGIIPQAGDAQEDSITQKHFNKPGGGALTLGAETARKQHCRWGQILQHLAMSREALPFHSPHQEPNQHPTTSDLAGGTSCITQAKQAPTVKRQSTQGKELISLGKNSRKNSSFFKQWQRKEIKRVKLNRWLM